MAETNEKKRVVPVLNNRAGQIQIPTARAKDGSIDSGGLLFLIPGYNLVDEKTWDAAKKNTTIKLLLEEKIPLPTSPESRQEKAGHPVLAEGRPVDAAEPLKAMGQEEALRFIDELYDTRLLKKLRSASTGLPAVVQQALVKQLEFIEKPKQDHRAALAAGAAAPA